MIKKSGIYLITEPGCLNPFSGAYQHISMGVKHLGNSFDLLVYLGSRKINIKAFQNPAESFKKKSLTKTKKIRGPLYGIIKDIYIFLQNLGKVFGLIRLLRNLQPDFIYERAAHLNYAGLIAAKFCKIPHFYEANGLQFESKEQFYKSFFKPLSKWLEREAYKNSNHVFFVGSYGDYWKIRKRNWTNVENGVETQNILPNQKDHFKTEKTRLCFVGKLMAHQGLDLLVDGLSLINNRQNIQVNLIGVDLELIAEKLENIGVETIYHGYLDRDRIIPLLSNMDIGLICGSPSYQSCMKLFDYGAAGLPVLAPQIHNLKYWFTNEIVFFDGSALDFSKKLIQLAEDPDSRRTYSRALQSRIKNKFTWISIFEEKIEIIKNS